MARRGSTPRFADLDVGQCFEFWNLGWRQRARRVETPARRLCSRDDPDYMGESWPGLLKKTGRKSFSDTDTGRAGTVQQPRSEPVEESTCPLFAGRLRGLKKRKRRGKSLSDAALDRCLEKCDPVAFTEAKWKHGQGKPVRANIAMRLRRCLQKCKLS